MGIRATIKAFIICQAQKVLIPSRIGEIVRLYHLSSKYSNKRKINQDRI